MKRHQGSIFWSLILISVGVLFLLSNLKFDIRPWSILAKYWPVLIIFWGLSKLVSYFLSSEDPALGRRSLLTGGDVVLLLFLLVLGTTITKAVNRDIWPHWSNTGEPDDPFGDSRQLFTFDEEVSRHLGSKDSELEISNKYGNITVSVHSSPEVRIKMEKRIKARTEELAKDVAGKLRIRVEGRSKGLSITSNRDDLTEEQRDGLQTHIFVWVPEKNLTLHVSNQYGSVSMDGVAGNHSVNNGYGPVGVKNIDGRLNVENKYGPIDIRNLTGDCEVRSKYGPVGLDNIGGNAQIDNGYGPVVLKKVKGSVSLTHKYGSLEASDLESTLTINGRYVEVAARNVSGDVQIATSYKNVDLENVLGTINIQEKHGDIKIKNLQPPSKSITIDAEYSGVAINLPRDSRFQIDAYSKNGKLVSTFDSIQSEELAAFDKGQRVTGSQGTGGPTIIVNTSYRDIHLDGT